MQDPSHISMQDVQQERAAPRQAAELTPLIGREQEVELLCDLLARPEVRLLTLLGTGGVGKTRLASHVAFRVRHIFRDGIHFIPLALVRDPSMVVPALAESLHVQERRGCSLLELVQITLQERRTLLVLDNFEHLVQTAPLLEDLLLTCPFLTILVTSRDILHLRVERQFPLAPLPLPEQGPHHDLEALAQNPAVALFLERAQAIVPTFQLTPDNAQALVDICIALDGLPLALELAVARIKTLPPQALLSRLSERFTLLIGGARTLPERQRTLRNTLQWSYDLLSSQEQWLFRQLSVFVGGCTLDAVEAVTATVHGSHTPQLDLVAALVDKNLLIPVPTEGEEPRFRMLETVREYGLTCLREQGESAGAVEAHARYYLGLAEQADAHLKGLGQQALWLRWLIAEQANLRVALSCFLERQDAQSMLRLSGVLWWFWTIRGVSSEALAWLQTALQLPGADASTAARARALCGVGYVTTYLHNHGQKGIAMLSECLSLYQHRGDQPGLAESYGWFAQVQLYVKDYAAARALAQEGIALSEAMGERRFVAFNHSMLALVIEKQGDEVEAIAQWEYSLALGRELDEQTGLVARALRHLASLAYARGDFAQSRALLEENLAIAHEAGNASAISWSLARLAQLTLMENDDARASTLCADALVLAREAGDPYVTSYLHATLGKIAQTRGEHERAIASYRESLARAAAINASEIIGYCLLGLAQEALAASHFSLATRLLAAATHHLSINRQLAPSERAAYERTLAELRTRLDTSTFSSTWAEGEAMPAKQALTVNILHQQEESLPPSRSDAAEPAHGRKPAVHSRSPDTLTAREVEVLRLLAQGYTDAQIAEGLVISTRTVNAHLTSIYRKIRVSSRHAASHYARIQHLV